MPDERQDSVRQGIGVPPESQVGQAAAEEKRRRNAEGPPIGGGMGGTANAESAPDEALMNAELDGVPGAPGAKGDEG